MTGNELQYEAQVLSELCTKGLKFRPQRPPESNEAINVSKSAYTTSIKYNSSSLIYLNQTPSAFENAIKSTSNKIVMCFAT